MQLIRGGFHRFTEFMTAAAAFDSAVPSIRKPLLWGDDFEGVAPTERGKYEEGHCNTFTSRVDVRERSGVSQYSDERGRDDHIVREEAQET